MRALPFPADENFYSNNINDHKMDTKHATMSTIIIIMTILVNIKKTALSPPSLVLPLPLLPQQ